MYRYLNLIHLNRFLLESLKMAAKSPMERVKENARITKEAIVFLKEEVYYASLNNLFLKALFCSLKPSTTLTIKSELNNC